MSQSRAQLSDEKRKIKIVMEKENKKKEKWYNQKKQYPFFWLGWKQQNDYKALCQSVISREEKCYMRRERTIDL